MRFVSSLATDGKIKLCFALFLYTHDEEIALVNI